MGTLIPALMQENFVDDYLKVLALAAMPALGNFIGAWLTDIVNVSQRTLSLALHSAAGVALAVVSIELMPRVLRADPPWLVVLAFVAGGAFFILIDHFIGLMRALAGTEIESAPLAIFFGVAVDLFSDGVMVGTGSTISIGLGLLLALGQLPANMPEGFATIAAFKRQRLSRRKRLALAASLSVAVPLGASIGYWVVRDQPEIVKLVLLSFTSGILVTVVVEEMIPAAHEGGDAQFATAVFVGGFALFTLLSVYLG